MWNVPPIQIVDLPAQLDHFSRGRPGRPRIIVLHGTGGIDSRAWLTRTSSPPVSVHRLISTDGVTYKLVSDNDSAWGCGPSVMGPYYPGSTLGNLNSYALQLELENEQKQGSFYPTKQILAAGHQIAEWLSIWGPMPILHHAMIDERKSDPVDFHDAALWEAIMFYWQ